MQQLARAEDLLPGVHIIELNPRSLFPVSVILKLTEFTQHAQANVDKD